MKLVIIDGYTLNPGDLSWDALHQVPNLEVIIYNETKDEDVIDRCSDADYIFTNKVYFDKTRIDSLPRLKYIGVSATGYNIINVLYAKEKGITVTNVREYSTPSTAQHTFALLLEITNQVGVHNQSVKDGEWIKSEHFCYWKTPLQELEGKTIGLIGFGEIAKAFAKMCLGFNMNVLVNHPNKKENYPEGIRYEKLNTMLSSSDIISLHCPLTKDTKEIINASSLSLMKANAILLNTARGGLINEKELAEHLIKEKTYSAGLDVLTIEPHTLENPLYKLKNCIITPHIAWASLASRKRLIHDLIASFTGFVLGKKIKTL